MNKMCLAYLVALLVALHLISTQGVQAQGVNPTATTTKANSNLTSTSNGTSNGCGRTDAFTPLLPLTVAAFLLSWP